MKKTFYGNYLEKSPVRIWKRYIPLLIDLLISNNFSLGTKRLGVLSISDTKLPAQFDRKLCINNMYH